MATRRSSRIEAMTKKTGNVIGQQGKSKPDVAGSVPPESQEIGATEVSGPVTELMSRESPGQAAEGSRKDSTAKATEPATKTAAGRKRKRSESASVTTASKKRSLSNVKTVEATEQNDTQAATNSLKVDLEVYERHHLGILVAIILSLRLLRQKHAERRQCMTEQGELRRLIDFNRSQLLAVPPGDEYREIYDILRFNVSSYEEYLEHRGETERVLDLDIDNLRARIEAHTEGFDFANIGEMVPALRFLQDSPEFQKAYERCQSVLNSSIGLNAELKAIDENIKNVNDKMDEYARRMLSEGLEGQKQTLAPGTENVLSETGPNSVDDYILDLRRLTLERQELESDERQSKQDHLWQKEILTTLAEKALVEAGILPPFKVEPSASQIDTGEQQQQQPQVAESGEGDTKIKTPTNPAGEPTRDAAGVSTQEPAKAMAAEAADRAAEDVVEDFGWAAGGEVKKDIAVEAVRHEAPKAARRGAGDAIDVPVEHVVEGLAGGATGDEETSSTKAVAAQPGAQSDVGELEALPDPELVEDELDLLPAEQAAKKAPRPAAGRAVTQPAEPTDAKAAEALGETVAAGPMGEPAAALAVKAATKPHTAPTAKPPNEARDAIMALLERNHIRTELSFAQEQLRAARLEWEGSRKPTEKDLADEAVRAGLEQPISADDEGALRFMRRNRATRSYVEAEERCQVLREAARRAGVIGKFPIDQTSDFEDRSGDGYADAYYIELLNNRKPRVESWMPLLSEPDNQTPPSSPPVPPESIAELNRGSLDLGEDYMETVPPAKERERIDNYQRACDKIREEGSFPKASGDQVIVDQREELRRGQSLKMG